MDIEGKNRQKIAWPAHRLQDSMNEDGNWLNLSQKADAIYACRQSGMAKLCCNRCRSLVSGPNTASACCDSLCSESEPQMGRASASPVVYRDRRRRLVSRWLRFGMLLLCMFREQPHHSSKPDPKHRSFIKHKIAKPRKANIPSSHVHRCGRVDCNAFENASSSLVSVGTC